MTIRHTNRINMIDGTIMYLNTHATEWNGEAMIVEDVNYLKERREKIGSNEEAKLQSKTTPVTKEQVVGINVAIDLASTMATRIALFAKKTGNLPLLADVDYAKTELDDGTFAQVMNRLRLIAKRGKDNLAALAPFKVKDEDVAKLTKALDDVKDKPAERKSKKGELIQLNASEKKLLKEILTKMDDEQDDEIKSFCENADFVSGYFAVRRIDDRRNRGKAKENAAPPKG